MIGRERARSERVLHLDDGDSFDGAPIFNYFNGEPEIRTLSAIGTDVSLVANHEFDRGALNLGIQLQKWATFPVLAANYLFDDPSIPGASPLGGIVKPFVVFDLDGLRVGVIGMGNLSSLGSLYSTPNRLGITPLNTTEVAQFYVDLLRPQVDLVVVLSHLGVDVDVSMIQQTEGIDAVLGSHNHIVLQPPKRVQDCSYYTQDMMPDGTMKSYILLDCANSGQAGGGCMYNSDCGTNGICFGAPVEIQQGYGICKVKRYCNPREVLLSHSGAFAKYVGRIDLVVSNDPSDLTPPYDQTYDKLNGFELVTTDYELFPVTEQTPTDPVVTALLEPYEQTLDAVGNLNEFVGYSLNGSKRSSTSGGDSALGNVVATAMWQRPGIQTDFAMTNTTGIRADVVPGPVAVSDLYNIFPFNNTITTMDLSGTEVQELFDYVAIRSSGRGCISQVQIAGARLVINCNEVLPFDISQGNPGHATNIYIGALNPEVHCSNDADCPHPAGEPPNPNQCDTGLCIGDTQPCSSSGQCCSQSCVNKVCALSTASPKPFLCLQPVDPLASYSLATSNYLAAGGSGFFVLKNNTTQLNTGVQQRDALIDYVRGGLPCGSNSDGELTGCSGDNDCANVGQGFVCACPQSVCDNTTDRCTSQTTVCVTTTAGCGGKGTCVLGQCRDDVAALQRSICQAAPSASAQGACETSLEPCAAGGQVCPYLACIDTDVGNYQDGRIIMEAQ